MPSVAAAAPAPPKTGTEAEIRKKYKKLSGRKHVLMRPDMYVGPTGRTETEMFVYEDGAIRKRVVTVSPALIKIFDEVLVNARDHVTRCITNKAENQVTKIDVTIDAEAGTFSVRNNGEGIDIAMHPDHKLWVPEMIFAHLRTSTTYEEEGEESTVARTIGGKNWYGAKLAFVFATGSSIETVDAARKKMYKQSYGPNLETIGKPTIARATKKPYTHVTVTPDKAKLGGGGQGFDSDTVAVLSRRVYDIAAVTDKTVQVTLNGEKLNVRSLEHYASLVLGTDKTAVPRVYERANERWEYVVAVAPNHEPEQISFTNGVYTRLGGSHVKHVLDQICKRVAERANKKLKNATVKPHQVRAHLFLMLNCVIENPTFDSQTKETMTLAVSNFGSKAVVSDKLIDKICKMGVLDRVTAIQGVLETAAGAKTDGRKTRRITGIPKLDDAVQAGTSQSHLCTLLLVEGDSAKTGVISGMSAKDHDTLGVFPLRGKLINVRGASPKSINDNVEITHLKKILGLETGKVYTPETIRTLRYGKVRIVTDQDKDGSHIKGLIANAFEVLWPSLLAAPGFLSYMNTPILKVRKGKGKAEQVVSFFSEADYESWLRTPAAKGNWDAKYYKGLGTSRGPEFKEYLAHPKIVELVRASPDPTKLDPAIDLAFSKKQTDERKAWLGKFVEAERIYEGKLATTAFIDGELRDFSIYDCERSIPNAIDGLKTSQRKVLFSAFKRGLTAELKVAQLAGYVAEHSAYHHGEASLHGTIINLAQDYAGSNNLNLLMPKGQFGSRVHNGSDSASPRYIFTHLSPLARMVFPEKDDAVLEFLQEDGMGIEPRHYVPIVPMLLVNGCKAGIGTGYSSYVPCYSLSDVIAGVRRRIQGDATPGEWVPAYRGFRGTVRVVANPKGQKALTKGIVSHMRGNWYRITELPITMSHQALREKLAVLSEGKKGEETVRDHMSYSTGTEVDVWVEFRAGIVKSADDVVALLGLEDSKSLNNMHAFNADGLIVKYSGPDAFLDEFIPVRRALYVKRRAYLIDALTAKATWLHEQILFVRAVCDGKLVVSRREDAEVEKDIVGLGVRPEKVSDLLAMSVRSLTASKVAALEAKVEEAERELAAIKKASAEDLWMEDLDRLETAVAAGMGQPEA
jgi:DNA topoisomerase-2